MLVTVAAKMRNSHAHEVKNFMSIHHKWLSRFFDFKRTSSLSTM